MKPQIRKKTTKDSAVKEIDARARHADQSDEPANAWPAADNADWEQPSRPHPDAKPETWRHASAW